MSGSPSAPQRPTVRSNAYDASDSMFAQHSRSGGPRPLHLTLTSVVATSPTPTNSSASFNIVHVSNDHGADYEAEDSISARPFVHSLESPRGTPPLSPSPTVTNLRKDSAARNKKRSSISYLPSNPQSPSHLQSNLYDASDVFNPAPSPLSSSHRRTAFFADGGQLSGGGLARSSSLGRGSSRTPRGATFGERSSTGSMLHSDSTFANGVEHLKERPPATLSEK